MEQKTKT